MMLALFVEDWLKNHCFEYYVSTDGIDGLKNILSQSSLIAIF